MNLFRMLTAAVLREPDAVAIVEGARRVSYRDWEDEILRLAAGLDGLGLRPGDHLVALFSNRYETTVLYWACQAMGLIFTPFNWRASTEEIGYVLRDAEARAVVYEDRSRAATEPALREIDLPEANIIRLDDDGPGRPYRELLLDAPYARPLFADDAATSLMLYTSGTTGRPKGVPRSHAAERMAAITCVAQMHYRYGEVSLGVMPLFHTMGIRSLLMSVCVQGRLVAMPTFDLAGAFDAIEAEKVSALFLVPTMFHDIVHAEGGAGRDLGSVRNIGYAGMSMTSALVAACVERFKPAIFSNFYGSSEIYTFAFSNDAAAKPGCAGRAGMGQVLRVVRADPDERVGPDDLVPQGGTGEIIASMDALDAFAGYWKRPDADEKAIRDGWYFTGDLGRFDEDGEIHILGRVDDMIISGGENIYAEEVEDVLARSPLVRGVAVIGMPHERWGETVAAFIEPAGSEAGAAALDRHCLDSGLARFKRPRSYVFVAAIPRSASGKLLRRHLRTGSYDILDGFDSDL